jgi:hypothetical protein
VPFGWDLRAGTAVAHVLADGIAVVSFVRQQHPWIAVPLLHQGIIGSYIMRLAGGENDRDGQTKDPLWMLNLASPTNSFNVGAVLAVLQAMTQSTVGDSPVSGRLVTDQGRRFLAYAGSKATPRVDATKDIATARLSPS